MTENSSDYKKENIGASGRTSRGHEEFKVALQPCSHSHQSSEIFNSSKTEIKRDLINTVFSNLSLRGAKLDYDLAEPFRCCQNVGGYKEWLGWHHSYLRVT